MKKILLVEDDQNISYIIKENMEDLGFELYHIRKGEDAHKILENEHIDLILMDVELAGEYDGFETARIIRLKYPFLPIIFTTARNSSKDIEKGFSIKHMDYVKKPFGLKEIELRINAMLGNKNVNCQQQKIGSFTFDKELNNLYGYNEVFHLTKLESRFLDILNEKKGSIVDRTQLIKELWGEIDDAKSKEKSLHNFAYSIRNYFKKDDNVRLEMVSKMGYRLIVINEE
jgi:two-component system alkaline phosphatase synthesis response regulator PhoP